MRVWVVTGCSAGFGKDICINALARGDKVIATCRGNAQERLADLIARGADVLPLGVTAPPHELQTFAERAIDIHGQVDVICNNAGYVQQGGLEETSHEETLKQYQTTVFGPLNIARAFLPHLRERRTGIIAMIDSMGELKTIPGCGVYTSAKAAITALTRTLAFEVLVGPFNIVVTCIEPGEFRTAVFTSPTHSATHIPAYEAILAPVFQLINNDFKQPGDPRKGAERIVDLVTGEGRAKGRLDTAELWIREAREWKEWSVGTDIID